MKKVILTKKLDDKLLNELKERAEVVQIPEGDLDILKAEITEAEVLLLSTSFNIDKSILDMAPNLKVISRTGVGYDNVDLNEATDKGIMVLNTPGANAISVAEHTLALMIGISKQLNHYDSHLRNGNFKIRRSGLAVDMEGKTLGLIGCGKIGRMLADKCISAFNMNVIGYDPFILQDLENIMMYRDIGEIFKNADYISLHLPKTPQTTNLIDEKLLSLMKPSGYIINTARGGIINEEDLFDILKEGKIAGAGLDVFEEEPIPTDYPFIYLDNVIMTPHSAALTKECTRRVAQDAVQGIIDYLDNKNPENLVNNITLK